MKHVVLLYLILALCSCNGEQGATDSCGDGDRDHADGCACGDEDTPPSEPTPEPTKPQYKLMQYGPDSVEKQIVKLKGSDEKQREMAMASIPTNPGHFVKHPELLGKVRDALVYVMTNDSADMMRAFAISKLCEMGEKIGPAMPALIKRLEHPTDCQHVAHNLSGMGKPGHAAIPRMIELLNSGPEKNRMYIADGLGRFGPDAASAVPALTEVVASAKKNFLRVKAAHALGKIGRKASSALEVLDENAKSGKGNLRYACKTAADKIRKG